MIAEKTSGIYSIYCIPTGKQYIGSSKNVKQRLQCHRSYLRGNRHPNPILLNSWNKYGEINFLFFMIEKCSIDKLCEREQFYINKYGSFNIIKDIERWEIPEEMRMKMSNSRKNNFKSGKQIPYQLRKIYQYDLNGNFIKEWTSLKEAENTLNILSSDICSCAGGNRKSAGHFIWKYEKYDSVPKYNRVTNKGKILNTKKIICENLFTNEIFYFSSLNDCSDYFKVTQQTIGYAIRHSGIYKNKYLIKFEGLVKSDELLENPEEDNQQPI